MSMKDEELAAALKQARTQPMYFAFVPKGSSDGALLMSKKKIAPADINSAKKEVGGSTVLKGRCTFQDNLLVMDLAVEPPASLAGQVARVIRARTGQAVQIEIRLVQEQEGDEESTEQGSVQPIPPTPPPPQAPSDKDRFKKALSVLLPAVQRALQTTPQQGGELQPLLDEANHAGQAGDFTSALATLEKLAAKVKALLAESSKPESKAPPPPQVETGAAKFNTVEFRKGLLAWETARKFAVTQIGKLRDAIINDPDAQSQPDFNELRTAANDMEPVLEEFHEALDDALQDASKASAEPGGDKKFHDAVGRAIGHIKTYQQELDSQPLFKVMDNGGYGTFNVHDNVSKALAFLAEKLEQVAR